MLASLQRRFVDIEETDFLVLATLLDPRFKDKSFSNAMLHHDAVILPKLQYSAEIKDCQIKEPASKRAATDNGPVASGSVWGCLNEIQMNAPNDAAYVSFKSEVYESEVDQYLAVPIIDFKRSPYLWWENHQH